MTISSLYRLLPLWLNTLAATLYQADTFVFSLLIFRGAMVNYLVCLFGLFFFVE